MSANNYCSFSENGLNHTDQSFSIFSLILENYPSLKTFNTFNVETAFPSVLLIKSSCSDAFISLAPAAICWNTWRHFSEAPAVAFKERSYWQQIVRFDVKKHNESNIVCNVIFHETINKRNPLFECTTFLKLINCAGHHYCFACINYITGNPYT